MDKKLTAHEHFMQNEIKNIEHELTETKNKDEITKINKHIEKLRKYHLETVRDFQHERLIHLIVTFFFAGILLVLVLIQFSLTLLPANYSYLSSSTVLTLVILIFLVTEIFYVMHYYKLENGTQRLYEFSKKLYKLNTPHQ